MAGQGGKNKKLGRSKRNGQNAKYVASHQRERNKVKKMLKHLGRQPGDKAAEERIKILKIEAGIR